MKRPLLKNRRVRPRIAVHLKATFNITGNKLSATECLIANISVSGAGLIFTGLAENAVSRGQTITLEFFIPRADRHISAQGVIVWTERLKDGIAAGVSFAEALSFQDVIKCCA